MIRSASMLTAATFPKGTPAAAGRRQDSTLHQPGAIALAMPIVTANMQAKAVIRAELNRLE
jgi:hypothetical protein